MDLKDTTYPLRVALRTKLNNVVKYNGVAIPFYDSIVPDAAPDYFVVIKDQNEADSSLKCGFHTDVHVTLDIVTRFQVGAGSGAIRDAISSNINTLLCSTDSAKRISLKPDFNLYTTVRTLSRNIEEQDKTRNVFRKVNIYQFKIQQLT